MNPLLQGLHDIDGLDALSPWPLAPGWWALMTVLLFFFCIGAVYFYYRLSYYRSWRSDTLRKLNRLEKNLSEGTAVETVVVLSEYMRRVAVKRFSRNDCASLMGEAWLQWLTEHDPKKFDWENKGRLLIELPYAPQNRKVAVNEVRTLIQAVKDWVR